MYQFFSQISSEIITPVYAFTRSLEGIPLLFAFFLGIVGAMAPCQFTANLGAITVYGNKSVQEKIAWTEVIYFIIGKIVVFSSLGIIFWLLGNEIKEVLMTVFPWFRKLVGPLLILIGLFLVGIIKFHKTFSFGSLPERFMKNGKTGAFFMGVSFSLGFCPTMFSLFFVGLMPVSLTVSYGIALPSIFAIGTSLPLLIALFLIWYFELSGKVMKKQGRKIGLIVQRIAGVILIVLGVLDTMTYW